MAASVWLLSVFMACSLLVASDAIRLSHGSKANWTTGATNLRREAAQTQTKLNGCGSGNPIDDCWQCDPDWASHREALADCAIGFGRNAIGGRNGAIYVVTDAGNDNPSDPRPGTLRYAVIQEEPLWIIFAGDMDIRLQQELIMTSYKTIDGRGADVHISNGGCITIQKVEHIIIHGIHIHDCQSTGPALVASSRWHVGQRGKTDGDGISLFTATNIWIDHNSLSRCQDGLLDAIHGSDLITISNNYFSYHDKVMLLGAHDEDFEDRSMQVTVAFNYFGPGLVQRLPRCRLGTFHVFNNFYSGWEMYAIGGSASPTINSEGNHFEAGSKKEVTKQLGSSSDAGNWRSSGDLFLNGAYFQPEGASSFSTLYAKSESFSPLPVSTVPTMTANAGPTS